MHAKGPTFSPVQTEPAMDGSNWNFFFLVDDSNWITPFVLLLIPRISITPNNVLLQWTAHMSTSTDIPPRNQWGLGLKTKPKPKSLSLWLEFRLFSLFFLYQPRLL